MSLTPETALTLTRPTEDYMCNPEDNTVGLEFIQFRIRDVETKRKFFEVSQNPEVAPFGDAETDATGRLIRYRFPRSFLRSKTIGTSLTFTVGDQPVQNLRMIERHYFKGQLLRSYDFNFGFCIPNSTNSWEVIYTVPDLSPELEQDLVDSDYADQSDSFYFVGDRMVMHCKAEYAYYDD